MALPVTRPHAPGSRRERAPRARGSCLVPHRCRQDRLPAPDQARALLRVLGAQQAPDQPRPAPPRCPRAPHRLRGQEPQHGLHRLPRRPAPARDGLLGQQLRHQHRRPQKRLRQVSVRRAYARCLRHVAPDNQRSLHRRQRPSSRRSRRRASRSKSRATSSSRWASSPAGPRGSTATLRPPSPPSWAAVGSSSAAWPSTTLSVCSSYES